MREILFRGKREDTGEWVYGAPAKDARGHTVIVKGLFECEEYRCFGADCLYVGEETVGQFTGLTDKNGIRIFEGDILKVQVAEFADRENPVFGKMKATTGAKRTRYWTVEWKNHNCKGAGWYFYGINRRFHRQASESTLWNVDAEIVGNIHDNPGQQFRAERGRSDVMENGVIYAEQDY